MDAYKCCVGVYGVWVWVCGGGGCGSWGWVGVYVWGVWGWGVFSGVFVYLFFVWCFFSQGLIINGFINVGISTLEKRFDLPSSRTGLIASSYDITTASIVVFVSYFWRTEPQGTNTLNIYVRLIQFLYVIKIENAHLTYNEFLAHSYDRGIFTFFLVPTLSKFLLTFQISTRGSELRAC